MPSSLRATAAPPGAVWVERSGLEKLSQRRGKPRAARTLRDQPIVLGGVAYSHGIGTRSISEFVIDLKGSATRFRSMVGIDDALRGGVGSVTFEVWADDTMVAGSGLMRAGDAPRLLSADLTGARVLTLLVDDGGDTSNDDEVVWAGAMIELAQGGPPRPEPLHAASGGTSGHRPRHSITGARHSWPARHRRNSGPAFPVSRAGNGRRPSAFLGTRAAARTGPRLRYSGIITGSMRAAGEYRVTLRRPRPAGSARRELRIVGGPDALARTPPMGWNSWNVWGPAVDADKVLAAAEWLERSGLAAHGYQYVVIDDAWMGSARTGRRAATQ